ncbi:hypothetical protein TcCL_ESM09583 [Trypanosoma cruzi]|nr:hypothetical protein TcCL_ESM09583 [Trypanosoma cruzi]
MQFSIFLSHVVIKHTLSIHLESSSQPLLAGLFLFSAGQVCLFSLREDLVKMASNDVRLLRVHRNVFKGNELRQILLDHFDVGSKSPLGGVLLGCRLLALLLPLLGQQTHRFQDPWIRFLNLMDPLPPLATPLLPDGPSHLLNRMPLPHDGLSPRRPVK